MLIQRRHTLAVGLIASSLWFGTAGCGDTESPTEPSPPVCSIAISRTSFQFTSEGGTGTMSLVASDASCTWSVSAIPSWIAVVEGSSGAGSGSVKFNVAANPSTDARSASFTAGGQTVTITQQGRPPVVCTYALDKTAASFNSNGGTGSLQVTAPAECDWTAVSSASWLSMTSASTGRGNGTIGYAVERNRSPETRSATITVADKTLTITQDGEIEIPIACEYSVAPVEFNPCMPAGSIAVTVTTGASCSWTANVSVPWLTITSGETGSGPGLISASFSSNYDAPREGLVRVRWPTPTAGQNVRVAQAGCAYAVSKTAMDFGASGGQGTFDVLQQSTPYTCGGPLQNGCLWSAVSDVPWIVITSSMPRAGDDRVGFTVAPNDGASPRTGRITVKDKVVVVIQSGR